MFKQIQLGYKMTLLLRHLKSFRVFLHLKKLYLGNAKFGKAKTILKQLLN